MVVPCEDYMYESLYELARDITTKSELHSNRVVYQLYRIPKLSQKLKKFWNLNSADFLEEIGKKKKLSVKELKELSDLFLETLNEKINPLIKEIEDLEKRINEFIFEKIV